MADQLKLEQRNDIYSVADLDQLYLSDKNFSQKDHSYIRKNAEYTLKELSHACRTDKLPLRPIFVDRKKTLELAHGCAEIFKASHRLFIKDFQKNKEDYLLNSDVPDFVLKLEDPKDRTYRPPIIARPDVLVSNGEYKIAECNTMFGAAFVTQTSLQSLIYNQTIGMRSLRLHENLFSESPLVHLCSALKKQHPHAQSAVILATRAADYATTEMHYYADFFSSFGLSTSVIYQEDIKYDGEDLVIDNAKPDLIIRLLPLDFLTYKAACTEELVRSFEIYIDKYRGNPNRYEADDVWSIISNKKTLALLWQNKAELTENERKYVERYIPWSASVGKGKNITDELGAVVSSEQFLLRTDKSKLVLKNGFGFQEKFVLLGEQSSQADWDEKCKRALDRGDCIVQRYYPSDTYTLPFYSEEENRVSLQPVDHEYGIYIIDGNFGGLLSHYKPAGSENIKSNWNTVVVFGQD